MTRKTTKKPPMAPQLREPTNREKLAIEAAVAANAERPKRVSVAIEAGDDGRLLSISYPHSDGVGWNDHLTETFGTSSPEFANQSFARIGTAVANRDSHPTEAQANAALALLGAIAPKDEFETVIAEQIVACHTASLDFLNRARLNAGTSFEAASAYAGMSTKVSRTMAAHVEALTKLRTGGKQQVEVRYIYVDARGGQNIIASHLGGGGNQQNGRQPHGSDDIPGLPFAPGAEMWSAEPSGRLVPVPRNAREEALSDSRRQEPGCAEGQSQRSVQARNEDARIAGRETAGQSTGGSVKGSAG